MIRPDILISFCKIIFRTTKDCFYKLNHEIKPLIRLNTNYQSHTYLASGKTLAVTL